MAKSLKALYPGNRISTRPIKETETNRINRYKYSWKIAVNDHPTPSDDFPMHQVNTGRALLVLISYSDVADEVMLVT